MSKPVKPNPRIRTVIEKEYRLALANFHQAKRMNQNERSSADVRNSQAKKWIDSVGRILRSLS